MPGRSYSIKKKHKSSKYRRNRKSHKNKNKSRKNLRTQRGGNITPNFLVTLESDYTKWVESFKNMKDNITLPKDFYITYKLNPKFYFIVIKKNITVASYKRLNIPETIQFHSGDVSNINITNLEVIEVKTDNDKNSVNGYTNIIKVLNIITLLNSNTITPEKKNKSNELDRITQQTTTFLEKDTSRTLERGNYFIFKISNNYYIVIVLDEHYTIGELIKLEKLLEQGNKDNEIFNNTQYKVSIYTINIKGNELKLERAFYKKREEKGDQHTQTINIDGELTFENVEIEGIKLNNNILIGVSEKELKDLYTNIIDKNLELFNELFLNEHLEIVGEPGRCSQFISLSP